MPKLKTPEAIQRAEQRKTMERAIWLPMIDETHDIKERYRKRADANGQKLGWLVARAIIEYAERNGF